MTDAVRVGLVGCGRLAERGYLPALALTESVTLVAVADRDEGRCAALAPDLPAYASARDLLAREEIELLVLAHAAADHVPDACAAAAVGVSALVEKPPARTAPEARQLVGLDPPAWLGFNRRFEPEMADVRARMMRAPVTTLELELSIMRTAWDALDGSEAAVLDLGPHLVDLALWLTGARPVRVRVSSMSGDAATFELELDEVTVSVNVSHARAWRERVVGRDARGRTVARLDRGGAVRRLAARARAVDGGPLVRSLAAQLTAVAAAGRGNAFDARLATAAEGVVVMEVIDAVVESEGRDRAVSWD